MLKFDDDPFGLEAQIARAQAGMRPKPRPAAKLSQQYAAALDKLAKAEAKMRRAFTAWDKQRATVRRLEKRLDKLHTIGS